MGSSYLPPPEQNVVNVGDEISASTLAGLQAASPAGSSANPFATNSSVASAIAAIPPPTSGKIASYDNFKTYNAGDQVLFDDKLYRFNAFIGAAGYAPNTHPAAWTEISAGPSEYFSIDPSVFNIPLLGSTWSSSSSNGGFSYQDASGAIRVQGPFQAAGFSQRLVFESYMQKTTAAASYLNFSKRLIWSFRFSDWCPTQNRTSNIRFKVHLGTPGAGGIGIQKFGHQTIRFLNHDGTTERVIDTAVDTEYATPTDVLIDSDGLGTSKLYINGVLRATSNQAITASNFIMNNIQIAAYASSAVASAGRADIGVAGMRIKFFD